MRHAIKKRGLLHRQDGSHRSNHRIGLVGYFRLFIVATGYPSERRPQKTVSCYGG